MSQPTGAPGLVVWAINGVWGVSAVTVAAASGHLPIGLLIIAAVLIGELLATSDAFGSKALSGMLALLAILSLGWPAGVVVALGPIAWGDLLLRRQRRALVAWWAVLVATMLTAAAWTVGVRGTAPAVPEVGRGVATASLVIFAVWTGVRASRGSSSAWVGAAIVGIIGIALTGAWWMPAVPPGVAAWVGAGMVGMGAAAAYMLADMVATSAVLWRSAGRQALAFWPEHMPTLFFRYAGQGVLAGLAAHSAAAVGTWTLIPVLGAALGAQWLFHLHERVEAVLESTVDALASAIDARDSYTAGHSWRVSEYAARIAIHLGWSKARVTRTRRAGLLHDVGKLGVADAVLRKPGVLDSAEYEHIKRHAAIGQTIVSQVQGLGEIGMIVGQHHERWDGGGYPGPIAAREILPEARLVAIADVYDALTTDRPYRAALSEDEALAHLAREAGRQFDPELTSVFLDIVQTNRTAGVMFCYCATH